MIDPGKAVEIAWVNVIRQVRDRGDLFFVLVLPTIIIVALGLQFGGGGRARLGVVAPAADPAAGELVEMLAADEADLDVRAIPDETELRDQVEHGQLEAGVIIPDGFSAALAGPGTVEIQYLDTAGSLATGIRAPVEAAVARLSAITTAARVAAAGGAGTFQQASVAGGSAYASVPGVAVDLTAVGEPGLFAGFSQFTFGASTQLVMFMFLTSMTAATRLVTTRQLGVSRRMVAGPTSAATIIAGEAAGRYGVALLQAACIVLVSSIVFGVSWGDPVAAGTIIALFGLVSAGVAMLVGALASDADQAGSLGVFVGLALGALGGCMVPFQVMPPAMQAVARLLPHSWAVLGLQTLIRDGSAGIAAVAPNLAVLAVYGVGAMALAAWRFRKAIAG
jgi:linearmycin/streptolysin S transport system permease protein